MFESFLRERMDEEQSEQFDADLESLAPPEPDLGEKRDLMLAWGGEVA